MTTINLKDKSKKKKSQDYFSTAVAFTSKNGSIVFYFGLYLHKTSHEDFSLLKLPASVFIAF